MAQSDYPLIPLPNPGEGGPIPTYPSESSPAIPMEPAAPTMPMVPTTPAKPVIPSTPMEPATPIIPSTPTTPAQPIIPAIPTTPAQPVIPATPTTPARPNRPLDLGFWLPGVLWPQQRASVRFLNAAYAYPAFRVQVERNQRTQPLSYGALSSYQKVGTGYRTVTVTGADGYIYVQKSLPFQPDSICTVAVVNRPGGLDLVQIPDQCCHPGGAYSNIRVSNLAFRSQPLDVLLADGRTIWSDVRFKETTAFKRIRPGTYELIFADTNLQPMPREADVETLDSTFLGTYPGSNMAGSLYLEVERNNNYTVFLLAGAAPGDIIAISAK